MAKVERTDDSWRKTRYTTCTDLRGDLDSTDYVENLSPLGKAPQLRRDSGSVLPRAWGFPEWETLMSGTAMQFVRVISRVEDMQKR